MPGPNALLDEALQRAGWTPEQLASAVNARLRSLGQAQHQVHPKTPWKWLRRGEKPHPPLPGVVAEVLGERTGQTPTADGLGLASGRRASLAVPADDGLIVPFTPEGARRAIAEIGRRGATDARRLLPLKGPAISQHAHLWLVAGLHEDEAQTALGSAGSAPAAVRVFRTLLDELRRLDDVEGGPRVGEWAAREAVWAASALRDGRYGPAAERDLLQVFAELAQLAGWGALDGNRHAEAQRWHLAALHAAEAAGDGEFAAYVLCILAFDATLAGEHDQAVMILESAQQGIRNRASLVVRAMLAGWQARAHAAAGDRVSFERTLSRASRLYDRARVEDAPEWAYWMVDPADLGEAARGWSFVGDHRRAVQLLTQQIEGSGGARDRALFLAYLAEAHGTCDADQAARLGEQALDGLAEGVDSPRVLAVVRGVAGMLGAVDAPGVRGFVRRARERTAGAR